MSGDEDYLKKRYGEKEDRRRKKKKKKKGRGMRVIDDDTRREKIWDEGAREASRLQHEKDKRRAEGRRLSKIDNNKQRSKNDTQLGISAMLADGSGWNQFKHIEKAKASRKKRPEPDSDEDSDQAVVRRPSGKDAAPVKRTRHDSDSDQDFSRPAKRVRHDTDSEDSDQDISARPAAKKTVALAAGSDSDSDIDLAKPAKTVQNVAKKRTQEADGDGAPKTVFRDKTGKKVTKEDAAKPVTQWTTQMDWGTGLVQKKMAKLGARRDEKTEKEQYEEEMRNRTRLDDPLRGDTAHVSGAPKRKGAWVKSARPMFKGHPWQNRQGILPGFRWDGKDRGNGFEGRYIREINAQGDHRRKKHQWSTQDM